MQNISTKPALEGRNRSQAGMGQFSGLKARKIIRETPILNLIYSHF